MPDSVSVADAAFVRALIARQPKTFAIAVSGAFVYALCTVASSIVISWVIDHVIVPRFDEEAEVDEMELE